MKISDSENDNGVTISILLNVLVLFISFLVYRLFFKPEIEIHLFGVLLFVIAGILTTFIGRVSFFIGIRRIGPSKSAAIKKSAPIFTIIFAITILQETIVLGAWIGIALIIIGIAIQGYSVMRNKESLEWIGFVFALVSAFGFGIGQGVRKLGLLYFNDPFAGALIGSIVALISYVILEIIQKRGIKTLISDLKGTNLYYYLGGMSTSFAMLSFFLGIWYTKVAYVGTIVAMEPIITVFLSVFFLKEEEVISLPIIITAFFVCSGAIIIAISAT